MLTGIAPRSARRRAKCRAIAGCASRFRRETEAVAAVEFALVCSILVLVLLGMCDVVPAWMARNSVQGSAASAADVAAGFSLMRRADMTTVYSAAESAMLPFSSTGHTLRLTNVFSDGAGNVKVYWSCGTLSLLPSIALTPYTPPDGVSNSSMMFTTKQSPGVGLDGTNMSYVIAEVTYSYKPTVKFVLQSDMTLSGVAYYLPRNSSYVGFPWDGSATSRPTAPSSATRAYTALLSNGAVCSYAG